MGMLSHLKTAVKWSFQAPPGAALARALKGVLLVALLAVLSGWRELGLPNALHWACAVLFLVLVLLRGLGLVGRERSPIWHSAGWGWLPAGSMAGSLLLWPVRLLWGALATGYTDSEQLPIIAHLLFWGCGALLAVGLYLTTRRMAREKQE